MPPHWRFRLHRLGRLRWIKKYRLARAHGRGVPLSTRLRYVLFDPEIESFSYELANEAQVVAELALALERPAVELAGYVEEARTDPELNECLARHVRWRFDVKSRLPLGNRLAWYLTARAEKPRVVVETGIYLGLGSLVLLRALARNAEEGHPGELISFDAVAEAGSLVRPGLRDRWKRVIGPTTATLSAALEGRRVGLMLQDTPHTEENQRFEFGAVLDHAAARVILFDGSGGKSPTLRSMAEERGGSYHHVPVRSRNHVFPGDPAAFAIFGRADPSEA